MEIYYLTHKVNQTGLQDSQDIFLRAESNHVNSVSPVKNKNCLSSISNLSDLCLSAKICGRFLPVYYATSSIWQAGLTWYPVLYQLRFAVVLPAPERVDFSRHQLIQHELSKLF